MVALLATALAAVCAVGVLSLGSRWIDRVAALQGKKQTSDYARSGLEVALLRLRMDAQESAVDTLDEKWAEPQSWQLDQVNVMTRITDLQGRFNLNNLRRDAGNVDEQALAAYRRLLESLGLPAQLADRLADWLGGDAQARTTAPPDPSSAGTMARTGRQLAHWGELAQVAGYTPQVRARLQPFVCVLDGEQSVNLNTAPAEVLYAAQPGIPLSAAQSLLSIRHQTYFRDISDYRKQLPPGLPDMLLKPSFVSNYFQVDVEAQKDGGRSVLQALVRRNPTDGRAWIQWQTLL